MAKLKVGTRQNSGNMGIHLFDPTKKQLLDARKEADAKSIPNIYIHQTRKLVVRR